MATDQITSEALDTLRTAVTTLVPPIVGGAVRRAVVVTPLRVKAVGLGGHVGTEEVVINNAPLTRELPVRRVEAQVGVVIRADTEAEAEAGAAAAGMLLLAADRRQLRELGLLRLAAQAPASALAPPPAPSPPFVRELVFRVEYEFVKHVTPTEGVIEQIPLKSTTDGVEETTIIRH